MIKKSPPHFLKILKLLWLGFLTGTLISCASTTTIRVTDKKDSVDRQVKIYMDGSYQGSGEVQYSDTKIIGSTTDILLKKEGCRSQRQTLSRSEQFNVGAFIGGLFVWPVLLWVMGYNPLHSYEFQCEAN